MGWRVGLERGEGGQTACQGGRGGQDPTGNLGLGSNKCFLTLFAKGIGWPAGGLGQEDCGRRTAADGLEQACTHPPAQQTDLWASGLRLMFTGELHLVAGCGVAPSLLPVTHSLTQSLTH